MSQPRTPSGAAPVASIRIRYSHAPPQTAHLDGEAVATPPGTDRDRGGTRDPMLMRDLVLGEDEVAPVVRAVTARDRASRR